MLGVIEGVTEIEGVMDGASVFTPVSMNCTLAP